MNKKVLALIMCLLVGLIAYQVRIKTSYSNSNEKPDIVLLNIKALTTLEDSESGSSSGSGSDSEGGLSGNGESSNGNEVSEFTREECLRKGGNWNMASVCVDGGITEKQCEISGEISILGVIIKGSYTKGKSYPLTWARYSCQNSEGNCCTRQGMEVNSI